MRPAEVAAAFVARINEHDLGGLDKLVTEDHLFIDALDNRVSGRAATRSGWEQYFALVPDYWIKVDRVFEDDRVAALFGAAGGTYAGGTSAGRKRRWQVPAAWLAETSDSRVAMWRVYADNLPLRRLMETVRSRR